MKATLLVLTLLMLLFFITHYKVQRKSPEPVPTPVPIEVIDVRMLAAVNQYRALHYLLPLSIDPVLQRAAEQGVMKVILPVEGVNDVWIAEHDHGLVESYCGGFRGAHSHNISFYDLSSEDAVAGWSRDEGHKMQMLGFMKSDGRWLDQKFNVCGCARSGHEYVLTLGTK